MKAFIAAACAVLVSFGFIAAISCTATTTNSLNSIVYVPPHVSQTNTLVIPKLQRAYDSTISILGPKGTSAYGKSIGSGTIVRYKKGHKLLVLTVFHVAKHGDPNKIAIRLKEDQDWHRTMRLVRFLPEIDLALLESINPETSDGPQVDIASHNPPLGEEIWIIGSPRGMEKNITRGILSNIISLKRGKNKYKLYRTDTDIFYGNSGGGVYNHQGQFIGVVMAIQVSPIGPFGSTPVPGGGLCIGLKHVKDFLARGK